MSGVQSQLIWFSWFSQPSDPFCYSCYLINITQSDEMLDLALWILTKPGDSIIQLN